MIQLYRNTLPVIKLSGPTYFSGIIKQQIKMMEERKTQGKAYSIMLILTDGEIHSVDMSKTKELLVEASHLPLSVIIVGVGNEEF
jgi:Copine